MSTRIIDGFEVMASTKQNDPAVEFYEPILLIRKQGSDHVEHCRDFWSQDLEHSTRADAQARAEEMLAGMQYVRHYGDQWEIG